MRKSAIRALAAALYVVLGLFRGYVALFDAGKEEPRQIFPTAADSLPDADRAALEKGIIVRNDRDLAFLLEDYLS